MDYFKAVDSNLSANEIKALSLPTSRKKQYFNIIGTQMSNLTKLNLLTMLFCLPLLLLVFLLIPAIAQTFGSEYNFLGNVGIGYPGFNDDLLQAQATVLGYQLTFYLLMIPAMAITGPAMAGMMRVLRNMVWGENVIVGVDFWRGLKEDWKQFTLLMTIVGVLITTMVYNIMIYNINVLNGSQTWVHTTAYILAIISLVLMVAILIYLMPLMAMYSNKLWVHVKNSILLCIGMLPYTLLFLLIIGALIVILNLGSLGTLISLLLVICMFVWLPLMFTTYVQFVMDKHINNTEHNRAYRRGIYTAAGEGEQKREVKPEKQPARYVNPKKLRKNVTITPLSQTYSRDDLKKLQEQKAHMDDDEQAASEQQTTDGDNE